MAKRIFTQVFVVVGTIIEKDGKILLVKEEKTVDKGKWNLPAGWLDVSENPIDGAKREAKEETGLDVKIIGFLGVYSLVRYDLQKVDGFVRHPVKLIFIGKIIAGSTKDHLISEISETKWYSLDEIEKMDKATLRDWDIEDIARRYFAKKRYSLDIIKHTIRN